MFGVAIGLLMVVLLVEIGAGLLVVVLMVGVGVSCLWLEMLEVVGVVLVRVIGGIEVGDVVFGDNVLFVWC